MTNGVLSPILQRRFDEQNARTAAAQPPNTLKITLGNDLLTVLEPLVSAVTGHLAPRSVPQPAPAIAPAPALSTTAAPSTAATMLLGSDRVVGPDITMSDFCTTYNLAPPILEVFNKHSYTQARWLHFLSLGDLDTMGFDFGHKAALREAVQKWSVPRT
ncbi:hypothetical protein BDN72DRAFT_906116 [Pluteus cervinus]|uniref:Uncharacterized protein n=1 Tax=Pluteus cervinus TaxID=181527 RepID=A0ACD3A0H3_9AGAR|nr:hypothetical protein BDN72DRAFT_906116 [Pluteus cervinus]